MAKSAIGGLVKSLAVEYARFGVTVNCVAPSMMETNFLKDTPDLIVQDVYKRQASYNDQSPDPEFRRHYGMAYYRTTFTVPDGARRVLRFDAVTHNAVVRLNRQEIASHRGGFLPFEADITALAQPGETVTLEYFSITALTSIDFP